MNPMMIGWVRVDFTGYAPYKTVGSEEGCLLILLCGLSVKGLADQGRRTPLHCSGSHSFRRCFVNWWA